ncbi:hypothetical protein ONE63_011522 [Megalurothrips usitatus]|uniref:ATP-dependent DNA helicase n=1 Tax=Megalurothrips usitatus TaxID=439358 RepID=A0AAV7WZ37_9NEOP|nr:hypothetical protein ONE63_011522 [Megalurothrips usitatus]
MKEFKVWTCDQCHESSLRNTHTNQKCVHKDLCWQFSNINNMNPGEVPEELQGLTFTEEQLIARVHPMITVFKLKGHQYGYKGNIINFCQDVKSFAKVLPHNINDLSSIINVIRKNKDGDEIQHQVRVAKIRNALMWLKNHNPFYADIEISEENLQLLPENGDITDNLQSVYDDSIDTDSHEDNINLNIEDDDLPDDILPEIHESYVPNLKLPDQEKQIHQHMKWPEYDEEPIDEFHTVGYIACAFPTLFPHGSADLRDHRVKEIKPTAYFKHLMSYHDQRFAKHKTFRFFAYNSLMRWTAISDGNVFIRNEPEFKNMTVLQKKYEVVDFWYRVEYQHRGSPHLHGLFWIKGAPDVTDLDKNIEKRDEVLKYFSNLISAINPDRNCDEPDTHPCKTRYDDIDNFQEDLSQLLNKVQRHSQHNDHCMRVNRKTKKKACRFNFPKSLQETSTLERIDETGEYEFNPQRNDDKLNKYNEYIIQLWRANMDIAPVISKKALVAYLTKYITKGETNSLALDELLNTIITTMDNENRAVTAIRKLFMKSCVERDISAQEVCHTLNGLKLYSAGGRKFNIVNFNSNSWLRLSGDDNDTFGSNFIEKYLKRPPHLENVTLWQAALIYNVPSWTRTAKDNIVRIFPRLKTNISEEFYRQKVLLHIPWRDENAMRKNRSWQDIYMSHNVNLFGDRTNTISLHDTIEDDFEENINTDDDITDEEDMIVSKMGPNKNVPHVGVGRRDIDIQHDWTEGMKKYEKYGCVADFENFIAKAKKNEKANDIQYILPDVNFSHDQHEVISLFDSQIKNILNQACNTIKTVIVQGKAGTGKSLIIKYMKAKLQHDIGENALLLGAPTGMAALLIGGNTIHSLFHIPKKRNEFKPLQGEREKTLCGKFKNVKFLIIDEFSLLGSCTLAMIDARCKQATGNHMEDFGGLHVYFFGDLKQLPPVKDSALYATNHPSLLAKHGKGVFNRIQRAFILSTSHRQNDAVFLDILDRISNGTHTKNDYDYISKRFKHTLPESEKSKFTDAIRLFAKSDDVIEYNLNQLMNAKDTLTGKLTPIARINAKHNCSMAKQGCKIMLRKNLWVHKGLVNGALGKIVDIVYDAEVITPDSTPAILMCEFETYSGPGLIPDTKIIPLQPELTTWTSKSGEKCSRLQFPIALAYACSIHKSQGMTLNKVVINVGDKEFSIGLMYVALSRVRTITNMIIHPFPYSRMEKLKCKGSQETIKLRNAAIQMLSQKSCT